jgi:alpha-amylase
MRWCVAAFCLLMGGIQPGRAQQPPPFSWQNAIVYFVLTDRFLNGDPANDHAYGRGFDAAGQPYGASTTGYYQGGDLKGLTQKVNEGYFNALGVNALWITCPFEQIHGWIPGGTGDFPYYGYHGYWVLDFTAVDASLGTEADFQAFVAAAHAKGLRVILDVVLNHVGYPTAPDMDRYGFGRLTDSGWQTWRPGPSETWHDGSRFLDRADTTAWARWWGPGWIRADLPGYDPCGDDDLRQCLGRLPDLKTESTQPVELPAFLQAKWGAEKTTREQAELAAFFQRTGLPPTPRSHVIKWITDWVRRYGIDGFRIDTAKHVELPAWAALKQATVQALRDWKAAHPDQRLDDQDFWMFGEAWGHGVERSTYFDHGFDAMLNFDFQEQALRGTALDSVFATTATAMNTPPGFQVLHYVSSHDTRLFDRTRLIEAANRLLLAPGAVQLFYGDETARPPDPTASAADQTPRSPMNWEAPDALVLAHWQRLGTFRARHPALAMGTHQKLADSPYTFARTYKRGAFEDKVIVVLGATGRVRVNVARVFPDNTVLRDAYSGKTAFVSYGLITLQAPEQGVLLLEEVQ